MKKFKYVIIFATIILSTACKKEDKSIPATTPTNVGTTGKTPISIIAQIAAVTGKSENTIPKDLDGLIMYGTTTGLPETSKDFVVSIDYFTGAFFGSSGSLENIGTIVANDSIIPFITSDTIYLKNSTAYFPSFTVSNEGLRFDKNITIGFFNIKEYLLPLPINVASNTIIHPTAIDRNKDITVKLQGNIVDGDTIIFTISDSTNYKTSRHIFPVTQTSYTFTPAQINAIVPVTDKKFYLGISVNRCRTKLLSNGKKVMIIATNGMLQPLKFNN